MTATTPARRTLRAAVYTRKSTEKGLDKEVTSLAAQRAACETYIESQRGAGWEVVETSYDDGGYSGGTTNRPAFQQLLADVKARKVDAVVVYKLDRLARDHLDFLETLRLFEKHGVVFASATERVSGTTAADRVVVNVQSSFAQYQREQTAERVRDKAAAEKRAGLWVGGRCGLGYDIVKRRLVVNEAEARQVREIFKLYLELGTMPLLLELERRCWFVKRTKFSTGRVQGGRPFDKRRLYHMLRNPVYIGKTVIDGKLHEGQHEPIVDMETWEAVQRRLSSNNETSRNSLRACWSAPLKGLIRCGKCGKGFTHETSTRRGRRYANYTCTTYRRFGARACPGSRVSVREMEPFVVGCIRDLGKNEQLIAEVTEAARSELRTKTPDLEGELEALGREAAQLRTQQSNLVGAVASTGAGTGALLQRLDEVAANLQRVEQRTTAIEAEIAHLGDQAVDADDLRVALARFDAVWDHLTLQERGRLFELLIEEIVYNADADELAITFRPGGVGLLRQEEETG